MTFDWKQRWAGLVAYLKHHLGPFRHWRPTARMRRGMHTVVRYLGYAIAGALSLLAVAFTVARFTLPGIAERKAEAEEYLSRAAGQTVRIGALAAHWEGLFPGLRVERLAVYAHDRPTPVVSLDQIRVNIALLPLLYGELRIRELVLVQPRLAFERLEDGQFRLTGLGAMEQTEPGGGEKFLGWILRQGRILIENGELQWSDRRDKKPPLHLEHVNVSLRNDGERHRLAFQAVFPESLCRDCAFGADISGNPFVSSDWAGEIYVRAQGLDAAGLPLAIREQLPEHLAGRFGVELWSNWRSGAPRRIEGSVSVADLRLPATGLRTALPVPMAAARVRWEGSVSAWRLALRDLSVALVQKSWSVGEVAVAFDVKQSKVSIEHVMVDELTAYAKTVLSAVDRQAASGRWVEWLERWTAFAPRGDIKDVQLVIEGPARAPEGFAVSANVLGWQHLAQGDVPGVAGLSGRVRVDSRSGEMNLNTNRMTLDLRGVFRAPLKLNELTGQVRWHRVDKAWQIEADGLRVGNDDIQASGSFGLTLPDAAELGSRIKVQADFWAGKGEHARNYYPVHYLPKDILAWMEWAFAGGYVERGTLVLDGRPRDFPFAQGQGRFEVTAHVRDAVYHFLEGWEPARRANVDLHVLNQDVWVTARTARLGALAADRVSVHTQFPNGESMDRVDVNLRVRGSVHEALRVLRAVKAPPTRATWKQYLPEGIDANGEGVLSLEVTVPFGAQPAIIHGEYELRGVDLQLPVAGLKPRDLEGSILFNQDGVTGGRVTADFLGGQARLQGYTAQGALTIVGEGRMTADSMAPVIGERIASRLQGEGAWQGTWTSSKGGHLEGEFDWRGLRASLPVPLNRDEGLLPAKLSIRTLESGHARHVLSLDAPGYVRGQLALAPEGAGWRFERGMLVFGGEPARLPAEAGLYIVGRSDSLDADGWIDLLRGDQASQAHDLGRLDVAPLRRVTFETSALAFLNRQFGRVAIDVTQDAKGRWSGSLDGPAASGTFRLDPTPAVPQMVLEFEHLSVPETGIHDTGPSQTDPHQLPALTLTAKSFRFGTRDFGTLQLAASRSERGWSVDRLQLTRPEAGLEATGRWETRAGESSSTFDAKMNSKDFGKTLEASGYPGRVIGGVGEIKTRLAWRGGIPDMALSALNGEGEIRVENGRLPEVAPGALGRLFSAVDLTALGRFLAFDFSPIYGKGFLFDRLTGKATIDYGNLQLRDTVVRAPAAKVDVSGRIGLPDQDFDLRVEIEPRVGDTAAIAGLAIWGPQVAAAVLAVQQVLKLAIREGAREVWLVKGPWSEPDVRVIKRMKIEKLPETPAPQ
jgi:uncharacterized protein (TIGR02099 family)